MFSSSLHHVHSLDTLKLLADPRRLAVLRRLMSGPATLSQLGQALSEHPAWVRHHLKLLEKAGLVELVSVQVTGGYVEKYYQARAGALLVQQLITPYRGEAEPLVLLGSHDLALDLLAENTRHVTGSPEVISLPVGSLDGLVALRQGLSQMAGCHLLDLQSGEYNLPYLRHLFPDLPVAAFTLAYREQGLLVPPGNPSGLHRISDLARPGLRLANRKRGSGTRLWLDRQLQELSIDPEAIHGYAHGLNTHTEVALAIRSNQADTGLGLLAAARAFGLDFAPLFQERYDLVIPVSLLDASALQPLLDLLHSGHFRQQAAQLGGYDLAHSGERLAL